MGANGIHNLLIVATQHDQVYAIDVDTRQIIWQRDFLDPEGTVTSLSSDDVSCDDIKPEIGITGTPVIDVQNKALYLVVAH